MMLIFTYVYSSQHVEILNMLSKFDSYKKDKLDLAIIRFPHLLGLKSSSKHIETQNLHIIRTCKQVNVGGTVRELTSPAWETVYCEHFMGYFETSKCPTLVKPKLLWLDQLRKEVHTGR